MGGVQPPSSTPQPRPAATPSLALQDGCPLSVGCPSPHGLQPQRPPPLPHLGRLQPWLLSCIDKPTANHGLSDSPCPLPLCPLSPDCPSLQSYPHPSLLLCPTKTNRGPFPTPGLKNSRASHSPRLPKNGGNSPLLQRP